MLDIDLLDQQIYSMDLGDGRLNSRLAKVSSSLLGNQDEYLSSSFSNPYDLKAYYRFMNNKKVSSTMLTSISQAYSLGQATNERVILAIQDSTELNLTTNRGALNMGLMPHDQRGLYLHNHLLCNGLGVPLGIFSQSFCSRTAADFGKSRERKYLPIEEKESYRWLANFEELQTCFASASDQHIIQICDREADISELLCLQRQPHVDYIIRSKSNRKVFESQLLLSDAIAEQESRFCYWVKVTNKHGVNREAKLWVKYCQLCVKMPFRKGKKLTEQTLFVVNVKEEHVPDGEEAIHWRLLTSMNITSPEQAMQVIDYYVMRWVIERFHYVLKSGRKIEQLQFETPEAIEKAVVLHSWVALQICQLTYLGRKSPKTPLSQTQFSNQDYTILFNYLTTVKGNRLTKNEQPTVDEWVAMLLILGGSRWRKDRPPGVMALWRGIKKFLLIRDAFLLNEKIVGSQ